VNIVYTDSHIAVVNKGFGEISEIPEKEEKGAVYTPLLLRETLGGEIYTVHRLDRTTEGLMVYARTKEAAAALSRQGVLEKVYIAAVQGEPEAESGEMRDYLYFDRRKGKSFPADKKRSGTKEALLRYGRIGTAETRWGSVSLMRVMLMTGRTHQIRVQFASRGMPLLGDGKYGSRANYKGCALFSAELRFMHPGTGERMEFRADPAFGFAEAEKTE